MVSKRAPTRAEEEEHTSASVDGSAAEGENEPQRRAVANVVVVQRSAVLQLGAPAYQVLRRRRDPFTYKVRSLSLLCTDATLEK